MTDPSLTRRSNETVVPCLTADAGWASCTKFGEELCGDQVTILGQGTSSPVMVLADGLGSGVKACILATLTAKIIATMMAGGMPLEECVRTIISTLPVCEVRKIAYAAFTIIRIADCREAEIIQYETPGVILLRNGKRSEFPATSMEVAGKNVLVSKIPVQPDDVLVAVSDGALHAGTDDTLNYAWDREAVARFLEEIRAPRLAAKSLCTVLRDHCRRLYGGRPFDDTTAAALAIRQRAPVNVLIGPAANPADDQAMLGQFFSLPGKRIVCGGDTAKIAAAYLGVSIKQEGASPNPDIPPISSINGVDLVTEGALTITRVAAYAADYCGDNLWYDDWCFGEDGASRVTRHLLDQATDVTFFVGRAVNPAHRDSGGHRDTPAKFRAVADLAASLETAGKNAAVRYW